MNRGVLVALARGIGCVALGALPFAAIGYFGSWWIVGGLVAVGAAVAAVYWMRSPWSGWL